MAAGPAEVWCCESAVNVKFVSGAVGPPQGGGKTPGEAAEGKGGSRTAAENCSQVKGEGEERCSRLYPRRMGIRNQLMWTVS